MEIEKKFLLRQLPQNLEQYKKAELEQGYLCTNPVVRIRKSDERYILTYKCRKDSAGAAQPVCVNEELEAALTKEGYEHLREKADHHLVTKTRYYIPLADAHTGELDIFHGVLEGLCLIEVEFQDEADAAQFCAPDWFGENVSGDERYTNSFLSRCDNLDVFCDVME